MSPSLLLSLTLSLLLLCTPTLGEDTCRFTIMSARDTTGIQYASFDLTGLDFLFPSLYAGPSRYDSVSQDRKYFFSVCGDVPPPDEYAEECVHSDSTHAAAYQIDFEKEAGTLRTYCYVAGRTNSLNAKLYFEDEYVALGPLGLTLTFKGGDGADCPDAKSTRSLQVNLRCPYFLNGYAPDPVVPQTQPSNITHPLVLLAPSRVPVVGYVREKDAGGCDYVVDVDSIYGCPLECLPPNFGLTKSQDVAESIELCTNRGVCGNVTDDRVGCLCDLDSTGDLCQTPGSFTINSTNAKTPMTVVSILLLIAVLALTVALFRKMRYLHKEEGNLYGNLQLSTNDSSVPAL